MLLTTFSVSDYVFNMTTMHTKSMEDFSDSFNIIFGSVDKELNLFNNGYFDVNVYDLD